MGKVLCALEFPLCVFEDTESPVAPKREEKRFVRSLLSRWSPRSDPDLPAPEGFE